VPVVSPSCYELLGVPVDAPRSLLDWARSQRRREADQRLGELDGAEVEALSARIDEAFQILADGHRSRRYRVYRAQLDAGRRIVHPEDLSSIGAVERAADPGLDAACELGGGPLVEADDEDAVTTLDEWDVGGEYDEALQPANEPTAFPGSLGLLADVVLAAPAPGELRAAPRTLGRIEFPPWLALEAPDPEAMEPPVHYFATTPGTLPLAPPSPDRTARPARRDRPPWEGQSPKTPAIAGPGEST
jgi:hypothetical protein